MAEDGSAPDVEVPLSKEAPALIAWVQLPEAGLSMPVMAP